MVVEIFCRIGMYNVEFKMFVVVIMCDFFDFVDNFMVDVMILCDFCDN